MAGALLTTPWLLALSSTTSHAADVVIVRGEYLVQQQPGERSGMDQFTQNVTRALDLAGIEWEMSGDSAVENDAALDGCRVAIFPHNGSMSPGEIEAIDKFADTGGKIILFYSLPEAPAARIGVKTTGYLGGDENRGKFDAIRFDAPEIVGLPATMKQGSWNITSFEATEGGARVIGTWLDREGHDTGLPAVALGDHGAVMNHVLLNGGPEAARFLLAVIGHWYPDVWQTAVERSLANSEKFGRFDTSDGLAEFVETLAPSPGTRAVESALAQAEAAREQARELAEEGRWPEALARLAAIPDTLGDAYAKLYPPRVGEMRAVWIHSPFNVDDWDAACRHLRRCGFNAVIVNMCNAAIAYYPSRYLRQHDRALEEGDQVLRVLKACRENHIELHVWRVNWNPGGNKERVEQIQADGINAVAKDGTPGAWLCSSWPQNRRHEIDTMLEIVENYGVDGIHFDYIRYHNSNYCYCDHCRQVFEEQIGRELDNWPEDVLDGDLREAYLAFRREQINVVVREVSERAHKMKPGIKVSAAVFGDWPGSRISIGQDAKLWVDEGWLDFVCPMDYTNDTDYLRRLTEAQVKAVAGKCPLYIGIGAWRHPSVATLVDQIQSARTLGADGFVLFAYESGKTRQFISAIGDGMTRRQTYTPHRAPVVSISIPDGPFADRPYAYQAGQEIEAEIVLTAESTLSEPIESASATLVLETTAGEKLATLGKMRMRASATRSVRTEVHFGGAEHELEFLRDSARRSVRIDVPEGHSRIALIGTMTFEDGRKAPFVHRSARIVGLTAEEIDAIRAEQEPPEIEGEGIKVGVTAGGYATASLISALSDTRGIVPFALNRLTPEFLGVCDIVIVAQYKSAAAFPREAQQALVEWVRGGGRAMLMHDAVGYREHPVLFPEIGRGQAIGEEKMVAFRTPNLVMGAEGGAGQGAFEHSYYDHINMALGEKGTVVVSEVNVNANGEPVVVAGPVGKGKVVLNGMVTGLASGDREVEPEGGERDVLVRCVRWLAQ